MSLTFHLKSQALKNKFSKEFTKPILWESKPLKAIPLTHNYGIIGTAFDYIVRFYVESLNKGKCTSNKWVSDLCINRLKSRLDDRSALLLDMRFFRAKSNYQKYLSNGRMTKLFLDDVLLLAKIDLYHRVGIIAPDLFEEKELDLQDLKNLYGILKRTSFTAKNKCWLNPFFGKGSILVGGADAHLIVEDILIDIKVTKHLALDREHFNQLLGYYFLSLIGGINFEQNKSPIKRIGIYYARHGVLWSTNISSIGNRHKIEETKNWLIDYFKEQSNIVVNSTAEISNRILT